MVCNGMFPLLIQQILHTTSPGSFPILPHNRSLPVFFNFEGIFETKSKDFILSTACSIAPSTPAENLDVLYEVVEKYGYY